MSRALLRNLLAVKENACSYAHGVLVFPSSSAIVPAAAYEVLCPVSYFRRGGEKGVLSQIHVSFLSFLPFSSFSSTYRQFFVYPPRSVQCSFALRCFFNVKNIPLTLFFFFLTSFPCRLAVLVFTLMQELTLVCFALSAPPLLTRPIVRGFVLSLTF